ncbi:hypothetical protein BLOT_014574 [Blomia tropicalis]|nr:hypothetical protein BLOT_014574 [Blomia tropicalis]
MSKKKQDEKAKNVDNNKNKQNPTQKKTDKKTDKKPKHNKVQPIVPPKSKINPQNSLKCAESTTLRSTDEPDSMRNSTFTSGGKSSTSMFLNKPPANNKKTKLIAIDCLLRNRRFNNISVSSIIQTEECDSYLLDPKKRCDLSFNDKQLIQMKYLACENDFHQFLRTHRSHSSETCCVKHYIHQCFSTNNFIKDCQQVMNESVCEKIDKFDSRCTEEIIRQCPNRIIIVTKMKKNNQNIDCIFINQVLTKCSNLSDHQHERTFSKT